ncbi:longevity-assurance protein, putative, partial [Ichthyophthirius multifiliis]
LIKDFESFFRFMCIIIIGIFIFFIKSMLEFRDYAHKNNIYVIPLSYNLISVFAAILFSFIKRFISKVFHTFVMEKLNDKYVGVQRELRAKKILKWTYDTLYYSTTTAFSFWAFKDA